MGIGTIQNRVYGGIILGIAIRGTIAKARIFRFRRGNGHYSARLGTIYQDQYDYFVPSSINNIEGEPARVALAAGVVNWKGFSDAVKKEWNDKASKRGLSMSGYNLYLRGYIKANA